MLPRTRKVADHTQELVEVHERAVVDLGDRRDGSRHRVDRRDHLEHGAAIGRRPVLPVCGDAVDERMRRRRQGEEGDPLYHGSGAARERLEYEVRARVRADRWQS